MARLENADRAAVRLLDDDEVLVKRARVRFPIELRVDGFLAEDFVTWPRADGRLEYVRGDSCTCRPALTFSNTWQSTSSTSSVPGRLLTPSSSLEAMRPA